MSALRRREILAEIDAIAAEELQLHERERRRIHSRWAGRSTAPTKPAGRSGRRAKLPPVQAVSLLQRIEFMRFRALRLRRERLRAEAAAVTEPVVIADLPFTVLPPLEQTSQGVAPGRPHLRGDAA